MTRFWRLAGVRIAAMLTLALGVTGGLYLADHDAQQDTASAEALFEAEKAEQASIRANVIAWSKHNARERAERADAEKARIEAEAAAEAARKKAEQEAARKTRPSQPLGPIPADCNAYSGNRAIGCALVLEAGFSMTEMVCLEKLWTKESGWNHLSSNGSSGAYGIPQAVPGSKMGAFGDDWKTNPATQIRWGLSYVKGRYDTPCGAWQFFLNNNWY